MSWSPLRARSRQAQLRLDRHRIDRHLLGEMLRRQASIDAVHVPYKGIALGITGLLAGDVQYFFFPVFVDAAAQVRSGARGRSRWSIHAAPRSRGPADAAELGYPLEAADCSL